MAAPSRPPSPSSGVEARPAVTLLVERARDFLAGGPADAATLVRRVCQLPGLPDRVAEQVATELLGPHREFTRDADGRWRLTAVAPDPGEVGATKRAKDAPSFEEWLAARQAQRASAPAAPPTPAAAPRADDAACAPGADSATAPVIVCPGDDDRLADLSYVVVDVETTGGTPQRGHRITEFAAVVVQGSEVREVYETLVNPERSIPPEIVKLTGITMEMVRDKPPFREVVGDVVRALSGHVFVAHNAAFDWRFVSAEVERATGQQLGGRRLCTVRLSRKLLPHLRSRSLGHVADYYGADAFAQTYFEARHGRQRPWRHSAAGDAVATAHCLLRLLADAADRGVQTWAELDMWLSGGTGRARRRRKSAFPTGMKQDAGA
jgi:DNA polymerase-3 subunit epsilon